MQFTKTKQASFRNSKEEGKAARLLSLLLLRVRRSGCQRHSAWYHSINQLLHEEQQTRTSSRMKSRRALALLHTAHNNLSASQRFHRSLQMQHGPKKHSATCPHTQFIMFVWKGVSGVLSLGGSGAEIELKSHFKKSQWNYQWISISPSFHPCSLVTRKVIPFPLSFLPCLLLQLLIT